MDLTNDFSLLGSTRSFSNRTKDIFGNLDAIEASHKEFLNDKSNLEEAVNFMKEDPKDDTEHIYRNLEINKNIITTFKKPRNNMRPLKNNLKCVGNKKDSSKWSHHSLADVPAITDQSNRQVAEDILQMHNSKNEILNKDQSLDNYAFSSKHIFKKPIKKHISLKKSNTNQQKLSWNYDCEDEISSEMVSDLNHTIYPQKQNIKFNSIKYENKSLRNSKNDDDYDDNQNQSTLDTREISSPSDKSEVIRINELTNSLNNSDSEDDFSDLSELSKDTLEDE